jgi:hypothetical protein
MNVTTFLYMFPCSLVDQSLDHFINIKKLYIFVTVFRLFTDYFFESLHIIAFSHNYKQTSNIAFIFGDHSPHLIKQKYTRINTSLHV